MMEKRLRLVRVLVQPIVMVDDGELSELSHPVISIPAKEWPTYSAERFARELAEWERRINAGEDAAAMEPEV